VGSPDASLSAAERTLAPPLVRVEFDIATPVGQIAPIVDAYAAQGTRVLLLAGFYKRLPSEAEAAGLSWWAETFGPRSGRALPVTAIEFGNETSFGYQYGNDAPGDASYTDRAATYGRLAATAAAAMKNTDSGVGLLVQADDGNTGKSAWVDALFAAVPDLDAQVAGWTVHPYGPSYDDRLARVRTQLDRYGATKPFWVTEWGLATDGGRCLTDNYGWDRCMGSAEAARVLREVVADMRAHGVAAFVVYTMQDGGPSGTSTDREKYFGVMKSDGSSKGEYTQAVAALLTSTSS
jgi:hypothetical protein